MNAILILSRDPSVIMMYQKLAKRLNVQVVWRPSPAKPLPDMPVLADADSSPCNPNEREVLVAELCAHAAIAPTACFGYHLQAKQRVAMANAGVVVAHGPGRILLRTLASWGALEPKDAVLEPDAE
jgi:hypothetical protein